MKNIEEEMVIAILNNQNLKSGTTRVVQENGCSKVYFYGGNIAIINKDSIKINDCGTRTHTTKSRINAILSIFTNKQIYQKDKVWYLGSSVKNYESIFPHNNWLEFEIKAEND